MSAELIATITAAVALPGSLRNLHRDIGELRERMARIEGLFEGFTRCEQPPAGAA